MEIKIKFKVVKTQDRSSIFVARGSEFSFRYNKDEIVEAAKESLGIMVFGDLGNARAFKNGLPYIEPIKIIKVEPIGKKKKTPTAIARFAWSDAGAATKQIRIYNELLPEIKSSFNFLDFYSLLDELRISNAGFNPMPFGTECYGAVKVLE
jgi:hypothetical protein